MPKQSEVHPVSRYNLPSKAIIKDQLLKELAKHLEKPELKVKVNNLVAFLQQKDADKSFLVVLLRHVSPKHVIFSPAY